MSSQYSDEERKTIEHESSCLICGDEKQSCEWFVNEDNGCDTYCCSQCFAEKEDDETGYWGMRGCCKCGEDNRNVLIMGSCVCEKYVNLCRDCATENEEGEWTCEECCLLHE
jgi:hypothetical protein